MSKIQKNKPVKKQDKVKKKNKSERKIIEDIIAKYKPNNKKEKTAQDSVSYQKVYQDGICKVDDKFYSKTMLFEDINYQLAENEDQSAIFETWSSFLNYFDTSIKFSFSFLNVTGNEKEFEESIYIEPKEDDFNSIREEYAQMLKNQFAKGNNGIIKRKYLTFGIEATSYKKAKTRLEQIELNIYNNFKKLNVDMKSLNGKERLKLFRDVLQMDSKQTFQFEWDWLSKTGQSTKDFIVPDSFNFGSKSKFKMGDKYGAVSFLEIFTPEISDRILSDFLEIEGNQCITMNVQSVDHIKAIKMIKKKLSDLERIKVDEQKKAVRGGYDMDVLPADLIANIEEAKKLLKDLQGRNERLFYFTFLILNTEDTEDELENIIFKVKSLAQEHHCFLRRLDYQQEQGFISSVPLGKNYIDIKRSMTTSATAGFMPFTTRELFQKGGLYYGINALSGNLLMADRKKLKNANGLILGTPGSGKSFMAKREILNTFLATDDDMAILDPEGEYAPLVNRLKGQVIKISPLSNHFINPMDINIDNMDNENPLILKSDFILSLFEVMMGEVKANEKSIIDKCLQVVYQPYFKDPKNTPMPILEDLYNEILEYGGKVAEHIADCMAIYVTGSLNIFNNRTNVNINNRIVCYDIKELGNALKEFAMLVVNDQIWTRVGMNRKDKKSTRYYIDEMHLLLAKEQTANYMVEIWKRFRKWGGIPTGLTQNVKDFLASPQIANIFENSDFVCLLNQGREDRKILAVHLNISTHQLSHVTNSSEGEGLLIYGNTIIPFIDHFPKDTELYSIMTTKLDETDRKVA